MATRGEPDLWDAVLLCDDMEFLVDLTGSWTLCKVAVSYSVLQGEDGASPLLNRIKKWERNLVSLLPTKEILRLDDFLLDEWNVRYDYLLIRNPKAVYEFIEWLRTQDHRYWGKLTA